MAEATWTTSQRGSGLGKEKHCQDENRRAGGGWVYFKRLHFLNDGRDKKTVLAIFPGFWARNRLGVRKSWQKLKYFTVTSVPFGATFGDLVVVDDINMNKCFFNP